MQLLVLATVDTGSDHKTSSVRGGSNEFAHSKSPTLVYPQPGFLCDGLLFKHHSLWQKQPALRKPGFRPGYRSRRRLRRLGLVGWRLEYWQQLGQFRLRWFEFRQLELGRFGRRFKLGQLGLGRFKRRFELGQLGLGRFKQWKLGLGRLQQR
jgi:hypothetical protein